MPPSGSEVGPLGSTPPPRPPGNWGAGNRGESPRRGARSRTYREFFDGPKPLGSGVERVMKHLDAPTAGVVTSIFANWADIVGEVIAEHARPQRITNGVLVLEVDDPAWASEMEWLGEEIVRRVSLAVETEEISAVKVQLSRK